MKSRYIVCNTFFSLPQFPETCQIVSDPRLVLRNILLCNLRDRGHFDHGSIYDPHWEGRDDDGVPEYRQCEELSRCGIAKRSERYKELYILFRTCYGFIDRSAKFLAVGYYKVEKDFSETEPKRSDPRIRVPVIKAAEAKFVSLEDAMSIAKATDMASFLRENNLYRVSFSNENQRFKSYLEEWLDELISEDRENLLKDYQRQTVRIRQIFEAAQQNDEVYNDCFDCQFYQERSSDCPLIKRIKTWGKVDNRLQHAKWERRCS